MGTRSECRQLHGVLEEIHLDKPEASLPQMWRSGLWLVFWEKGKASCAGETGTSVALPPL